MDELYKFDISDNTIKSMIELVPEIREISEDEVIKKELLLKEVGCSDKEIRNIISSNPYYLVSVNDNIKELFDYLKKVGFSSLNILFDSNPYILNLEVFEISNYIDERNSKGELLSDIIDDLESSPYLFNEI